jgi:hypothetical protein
VKYYKVPVELAGKTLMARLDMEDDADERVIIDWFKQWFADGRKSEARTIDGAKYLVPMGMPVGLLQAETLPTAHSPAP